ncbi:hypothetical protein [Rhodanobacter sp. B04]|uniref:hypothetical protein n=1 Tax=Rhodanobacter sp. B04 TaxID=1945860 RepID=UPI0020C398C5|nr:hypothetical protein [Rhodanobacter sp. B04]
MRVDAVCPCDPDTYLCIGMSDKRVSQQGAENECRAEKRVPPMSAAMGCRMSGGSGAGRQERDPLLHWVCRKGICMDSFICKYGDIQKTPCGA